MRIYNIVNLDFGTDRLKEFCINNLNSLSASIKSIIGQVRVNKSNIELLGNSVVLAWTTTNRPISTPNKVTIGVNTTTNKLNFTYDGGTTWYNADGTLA